MTEMGHCCSPPLNSNALNSNIGFSLLADGRKSKYKYQYAVSLTVKNIMIAEIVYIGYSTLDSATVTVEQSIGFYKILLVA